MKNKLVSIVISAFNEENNVLKLYEELVNALNNETDDFEFVYVDDGSTDNTYKKCKELQEKDSRVRIIKLVRNFGHEIAMTAGMDYAKGDAIIFMDCDLQHPPKYIPEMLRLWEKGNKIVLTKRSDNTDASKLYKFFSKSFYIILNQLSNVKIPPNMPDFRLIDRKYIELLKQFNEQNRLFRGLLNWIAPIEHVAIISFIAPKRFSGKSKYGFFKSIKLAMNSILQFSTVPLKLATWFGMFAIIITGILGIWTLIEHFTFDKQTPGYASIMLVMIFFGSIQLICLGIMGEYIGKIHMEVKKRPLYVADDSSDDVFVQKEK